MNKTIWSIILIISSIGAIKYGVLGLFNVDYAASIFGAGSTAARVIYAIFGISGVIILFSGIKCLFKGCGDNVKCGN